jgi:hypothetical protein
MTFFPLAAAAATLVPVRVLAYASAAAAVRDGGQAA